MASAGARHTFIVRSSAACGKTLLGKCPGANAYRPPAGLRAQPARHTQWLRIGRHYLVPGRDLESGRHPQARWPCGPAVVYLWTPKAALGVGFGGCADFHRGEKLLRRLSAVFFTRAGPGLPEGRGVCGGSRGGVRMASVPNCRPARRCGARIETDDASRSLATECGRPARRCGARIETPP